MLRLKTLLFSVVLLVSSLTFASPLPQAGGEIPWPLSNQHVVTVNHGQGLWNLNSNTDSIYFNVEVVAKDNGYDWIRVAELDKVTFEVLSWGEGFFSKNKKKTCSTYSNIGVSQSMDAPGRYIYMFPSGDLKNHPYLIRIVEVETPVGFMLGVSIINMIEKEYEHFLGSLVLKHPLACQEENSSKGELVCHISNNIK